MSDKKLHMGICHVCGNYKELSFEHIPPEKAFNNKKAKVINGVELIKKSKGEKIKWQFMQRGKGGYTLCADCNNKTGAWYANEYIKFAKDVAYSLEQYDLKHGNVVNIYGKSRILSVIKQVMAMFCSTLRPERVKEYGFDDFLLNKESNAIDKHRFDLRMYLSSKKNKSFQTGEMVLFRQSEDPEKAIINVAEIGAYPFGFILNLTPKVEIDYGVSLIDLFDAEYNEEYDVEFWVQCLEKVNPENPFPLAYKPLGDSN